MLYNLRADPFERGAYEPSITAIGSARRIFLFVPAQAIVAKYIGSFKEFPPRAKAASFTVADVDGEAHDSRAEQELMPNAGGDAATGLLWLVAGRQLAGRFAIRDAP